MSEIRMDEVKEMLEEYTCWLRNKTDLKKVDDDWIEITSPTLDRHNDYLQIYIRREADHYLLTDDGYIIRDLNISGCSLTSPRRKALLDTTLKGFGAQMEEDCLIMRATRDNFSLKKHNLLQAMLAVNDMFYLSSPHISSLFYDNVVDWFDASDIRYTPRVKFTGKSGYDNMFDFVIPKSKHSPERLIQLANTPSTERVKTLMFKWIDTRDVRGIEVASYILLNDEETAIVRPAVDAIMNYGATPVAWLDRDKFKAELAA